MQSSKTIMLEHDLCGGEIVCAGMIVGKISDFSGVHGIAVAPEFGRGFIIAGQVDAVLTS
jgi:hypothetical protein